MDGSIEPVQVFVRIRPEFYLDNNENRSNDNDNTSTILNKSRDNSLSSSKDNNKPLCLTSIDNNTLKLSVPEGYHGQRKSVSAADDKLLTFDHIFDENSTQESLYSRVKEHVRSTVNGYNATIFAYGATGSGKSHTMTGNSNEPGIIPRAISEIFSVVEHTAANETDVFFYVRLSYVELYNNTFRNLLAFVASTPGINKEHMNDPIGMARRGSNNNNNNGHNYNHDNDKIEVRESQNTGVFLAGPNLRVPVTTAQEAFQLIAKGNKFRATSATLCNEQSSRSHAILTVHVESRIPVVSSNSNDGNTKNKIPSTAEKVKAKSQLRLGKLHLVDLAGSERAKMSGAEGDTLVETQNINLSLTALGDVLSTLSRNTMLSTQHSKTSLSSSSSSTHSHSRTKVPNIVPVPYRNSKLTHLLKDSLGGNSKTIMIANVRGHPDYYMQSSVSLMYASRAKKIQNRSLVNHNVIGDTGIQAVTTEIERLRSRLDDRVNEFERLQMVHMKDASENLKLKNRLQQLNKVNEREKKQLESQMSIMIHSHAGELQEQSQKMVSLQSALERRLEQTQNLVAEQEKEIRWLKQALDEHEQAAEQPREQLERMQKLATAWQSQAEESKSELNTVTSRLREVENEKDVNNIELNKVRKELSHLEERMKDISDNASRMAAQLGEYQARDAVNSAKLNDVLADKDALVKAQDEIRREIVNKSTAYDEAKRQSEEAMEQLSLERSEREAMQQQCVVSNEDARLSRQELVSLRGVVEELKTSRDELQQRLSSTVRQFEEGSVAALEDAKKTLIDERTRRVNAEEKLHGVEEKMREKSVELDRIKDTLTRIHDDAKLVITQRDASLLELQETLKAERAVIATKEQRCNELEKEMHQLQQNVIASDQFNEEMDLLKGSMKAETSKQLDELRAEHKRELEMLTEKKYVEISEHVAQKESLRAAMSDEIESLRQELLQVTGNHEEEKSKSEFDWREQIHQRDQEIANQKLQVAQLQEKLEVQSIAATRELGVTVENEMKLREELEEKLNIAVNESKKEAQIHEENALVEQRVIHEKELVVKCKEIEVLRAKITTMSTNQASSLESFLETHAGEIESIKKEHADILVQLKKSFEDKQNEHTTDIEGVRKEANDEVQRVKEESLKEISWMESKMKEVFATEDERKAFYETEKAEMDLKVSQIERDNHNLRQERDEHLAQLEEAKQEFDSLKAKMDMQLNVAQLECSSLKTAMDTDLEAAVTSTREEVQQSMQTLIDEQKALSDERIAVLESKLQSKAIKHEAEIVRLKELEVLEQDAARVKETSLQEQLRTVQEEKQYAVDTIEQMTADHKNEVELIQSRHNELILTLKSDNEKEIDALKEKIQSQYVEIEMKEKSHKDSIELMKVETAERVSQLDVEMATLSLSAAKEREELISKMEQESLESRSAASTKVTEVTNETTRRIKAMEEELAQTVERCKNEASLKVEIATKLAEELKEQLSVCECKLEMVNNQYAEIVVLNEVETCKYNEQLAATTASEKVIVDLRHQIHALEGTNTDVIAKVDELEQKLLDMTEQQANKNMELVTIQSEYSSNFEKKEMEIAAMTTSLNSLNAEHKSLNITKTQLEQELVNIKSELKKEIDENQKAAEELEQLRSNLTAAHDTHVKQVESVFAAKIRQVEAQLVDATALSEQSEKELVVLRASLEDKLEKSATTFMQEKGAMEEQLVAKDGELSQVIAQVEALKVEREARIATAEVNAAKYEEEMRIKTKEFVLMTTQHEEALRKALSAQAEQLSSTLKSDYDTNQAALQEELLSVKNDNESWKHKFAERETNFMELSSKFNSVEKELVESHEELATLSEKVKAQDFDLTCKLEELNKVQKEMQDMVEENVMNADQQAEEKESLKKELAMAQAKFEEDEERLKEEARELKKETMTSIMQMEVSTAERISEVEKTARESVNQTLQEKEDEIRIMEEDMQLLKDQITHLRNASEELNLKSEAIKQLEKDKENLISTHETELARLRANEAEKLAELEAKLLSQTSSEAHVLDKLRTSLQQSHEITVTTLRNELEEERKRNSKLEEDLSSSCNLEALDKVMEEASEANERVSKLEEALREKDVNHSNAVDIAQKKSSELEALLSELQTKSKEKSTMLEKQCETLKLDLKESKSALAQLKEEMTAIEASAARERTQLRASVELNRQEVVSSLRKVHQQELVALEKQIQELSEGAEKERLQLKEDMDADMNNKIIHMQREVQAAHTKLAEERGEHSKEVVSLKSQHEAHLQKALLEQSQKLESTHTIEQEKLMKLNDELSKSAKTEKAEIDKERKELENQLQSQLKILKASHNEELESLQQTVDDLRSTEQNLKEKLSNVTAIAEREANIQRQKSNEVLKEERSQFEVKERQFREAQQAISLELSKANEEARDWKAKCELLDELAKSEAESAESERDTARLQALSEKEMRERAEIAEKEVDILKKQNIMAAEAHTNHLRDAAALHQEELRRRLSMQHEQLQTYYLGMLQQQVDSLLKMINNQSTYSSASSIDQMQNRFLQVLKDLPDRWRRDTHPGSTGNSTGALSSSSLSTSANQNSDSSSVASNSAAEAWKRIEGTISDNNKSSIPIPTPASSVSMMASSNHSRPPATPIYLLAGQSDTSKTSTYGNSNNRKSHNDSYLASASSKFGDHNNGASSTATPLPWSSPALRSSPTDQLIAAILDGDVQGVRAVVRSQGDDLTSSFWRNMLHSVLPLHRAVSGLHFHGSEKLLVSTLEALMQLGADPSVTDNAGNTALHKAIQVCTSKSVGKVVDTLVGRGASVTVRNKEGDTPLHAECRRVRTASVHVVRSLLKAGADVNSRTGDHDNLRGTTVNGVSPLTLVLQRAAAGLTKGKTDGTDDVRSSTGRRIWVKTAEALVKSGAVWEAAYQLAKGQTQLYLMLAAFPPSREDADAYVYLVESALRAGISPREEDERGRSALFILCEQMVNVPRETFPESTSLISSVITAGGSGAFGSSDRSGRTIFDFQQKGGPNSCLAAAKHVLLNNLSTSRDVDLSDNNTSFTGLRSVQKGKIQENNDIYNMNKDAGIERDTDAENKRNSSRVNGGLGRGFMTTRELF